MAMTLRPGESIVRRWDNVGKYHVFAEWAGQSILEGPGPFPKYANGKLIYKPDLSKGYVLDGAEDHFNIRTFAEDGKRPYVHAANPNGYPSGRAIIAHVRGSGRSSPHRSMNLARISSSRSGA